MVCVERNPEFVDIGRRVLPEARWECADVFDPLTWAGLGQFDWFLSNPPFGGKKPPLKETKKWLKFRGDSALMIIEIGMKATYPDGFALVILPQSQCPFAHSGVPRYKVQTPMPAMQKFLRTLPNVKLSITSGVTDCANPDDIVRGFRDTGIVTEIVRIEWDAP